MSDQKDLLRRALSTIDELERRARAAEDRAREPIAVVGMSCRFPGGVRSPDDYWRLLREGRSGIVDIPEDRWDVDAFYDPDLSRPGTMYTKRGGFVDGLDGFDAPFFRISPREAATLDPQHRLLLECAWGALEDAGEPPDSLVGSDTGVFVGITSSDYARLLRIGGEDSDVYSATGTALNGAAGRISFFLGLQGPCMSIDTACSSSLVAAHSACQALRAGECERALVGGVNTILSPEPFILFSKWGMISPTGACRAFDDGADGFVRGEGCGVLVLKRLSDAQAAGDPIHAVILGSAVSQDGASSGLSVPNGPAQTKAIRTALDRAGVAPAEVGFVEAHGTGTPIGDPIEIDALGEAYGPGRAPDDLLRIGSVKTSIGHLESAAGVAGLMKLVLAVREGILPPQVAFERPNTRIDWDGLPIRVVDGLEPWAPGGRRVGAVSGFGFTGTNVHMVVAQPPDAPSGVRPAGSSVGAPDGAAPSSATAPTPGSDPAPAGPWLLPLSARSTGALRDGARSLAGALDSVPPPALADVARTLMVGRAELPDRAVVVGNDRAALAGGLRAVAEGRVAAGVVTGSVDAGRPRPVAFLYSGQGSQYPGMGLELREAFPVFRTAFDRCADILRTAGGPDLVDLLSGGDSAAVHATEVTQPALFAVEYALTELYGSWGIRPGAVLGHSVGEFVAAHVAGVMGLDDAVRLVATRGRLMGSLPAGGGMLAVAADADVALEAAAPYADRVSLAAHNGPDNVVLSGALDALERIAGTLQDRGVKTKDLTVSHAFHSPLMEPMQAEWADALGAVALSAPTLPLVSNLTGAVDPRAGANPEYWVRHVREPVAFEPSMRALADGGFRVFLELGPRPVLLGMARRFLDLPDAAWAPTLRARPGEARDALEGLGSLFAAGQRPDWEAVLDGRGRRVSLPTYAFQRTRHWAAARPTPGGIPGRALGSRTSGHPLLGDMVASPTGDLQFDGILDPQANPLLAEHRVAGRTVFPAAGYIEVARAVAAEVWPGRPARLEGGRFENALVLDGGPDGDPTLDVRVVVSPEGDDTADVRFFSRPAGGAPRDPWQTHAGARIVAGGRPAGLEDADAVAARCATVVDIDAYQARIAEVGLEYGPAFRSLTEARRTDGASCGVIRLPDGVAPDGYGIHPGLLDATFHLIGLAHDTGAADRFLLPVSFASVDLFGDAGREVRACCTVRAADGAAVRVDLEITTLEGTPVARIAGLETRVVTRAQFQRALRRDRPVPLLAVAWRPWTPPAEPATEVGDWLVLAGDDVGPAVALATALETAGCTASVRTGAEADRCLDGRPAPLPGIVDLRPATLPDPVSDAGAPMPSEALATGPAGATFGLLRALAERGAGTRLALVTTGAHRVDDDDLVRPLGTALWGLAATAAAELPGCRVTCIDVDDVADDPAGLAAAVLAAGAEDRIARRGGSWFVARLAPAVPPPESPRSLACYALGMDPRGDLSGLAFRPASRVAPGAGQVEIEVLASGLNFRDVLNVLDMYPGEPGPLGNECCGRVVSVGAGVDDVAVGDLVTCIAEATFGSHVVAERAMVFPVPAELSIAQAAGFPIAYLTAWLALHRLGGIEAGHRVLIHSGAGGVGLAAVQIARAAGAEVYATAGTEEKRSLLKELGVTDAWDSRSVLPAERVREATGGHGVDLVLNALTGESIDEGIRSLAPGGRFLEIGLRELRTPDEVAALRDDVTYVPILLGDWCRNEPDVVRSMWGDLVGLLRSGTLPPPRVRRFALAQVSDVFRFMARARHVGRIAVTHEHRGAPWVRRDGAYVVTGGLGALGMHVAEWLAAHGAGELVLVGRRAPDDATRRRIAALEEAGAVVRVVAADVTDPSVAARLRAEATAPIRGIVHAAGVADDATLARHDADRVRRVVAPKADGALHLGGIQDADDGPDLDVQLFFSSGSALLGSPGQAAYAAANAFLDGLAQRLAGEGRAALSVGWGAWEGPGMAGEVDARTRAAWATAGIGTLDAEAGLRALGRALGQDAPHVAVLPMRWNVLRASSGGADPFLDELGAGPERSDAAPAEAGSFLAELRAAPPSERPSVLSRRLRREVAGVLGMADPDGLQAGRGFTEQGMDSLMAVELGGRLTALVDVPLPSTFAFEYPTLDALVAHLADALGLDGTDGTDGANGAGGATDDGAVGAPVDDDLGDLSEEELRSRLLQELDDLGH